MQSFNNNGLSKIQKEIDKALNFQDITNRAMGSVIARINSKKLEEQEIERTSVTQTSSSKVTSTVVATPPPKSEIRSETTAFHNENRVLRNKTSNSPMIENQNNSNPKVVRDEHAAKDDVILTSRSDNPNPN